MYNVVVLKNGDVFGIWTIQQEYSATDFHAIRNAVLNKVKKEDPDYTYAVEHSEHLPCDNVAEATAGILESLDNEIGF